MEQQKELLALKAKVMTQKIDKLYNTYEMLLNTFKSEELNALQIIKKYYIQMYNQLIENKQYEKYKEIEDVVLRQICKIELKLDEYIYKTSKNSEGIINNIIQRVKKSENFQNFYQIENELKNIETLKEILKLYSPYISKNIEANNIHEIVELKFEILYRKQVENLIYQNGDIKNYLEQYENNEEKEIFKQLLEKKINLIKQKIISSYENNAEQVKEDAIFNIAINEILEDSRLIERLIILDMKANSYNYINLLKAPIFNAHLCNIGNNPFLEEIFAIQEEDLDERVFSANKVNYALLVAILKSIITDENMSIIECEKIYRKFGFKCAPILLNIGQQCIKMIFDDVKNTKEVIQFLEEIKKNKTIRKQDEYCKIELEALSYEFHDTQQMQESLLTQILNKRQVSLKNKSRSFFTKKQKISEGDLLQEKRNIATEKNVIFQDEKGDTINLDVNMSITSLEEIREGLLALDDTILSNDYNSRKIVPLEDMRLQNDGQVYLTELPRKEYMAKIPQDSKLLWNMYQKDFEYLGISKEVVIEVSDRPKKIYSASNDSTLLWEKYERDFKDLGIDVKKCSKDNSEPHFTICIKIDDISDLPIDYQKIELLTKEELKKVKEIELLTKKLER